ncbi:hypothetical protein Lalb_Chr21g0315051 [Lupinus albus]|uniref:Uncharacterized protein n=1 Tax=Lupinus albus TaxID=3870 RepID=A0A6A4NQV9_LUPAL|nr:hypothetical protein Lalb_Chr21g0315051 [Lupinus albus]
MVEVPSQARIQPRLIEVVPILLDKQQKVSLLRALLVVVLCRFLMQLECQSHYLCLLILTKLETFLIRISWL